MTKTEFFKDIEEIKTDKLFITDSLDDLDEEIRNNCWSISMSYELVSECTVDELRNFLHDVKANRKEQLKQSTNKAGLIYYIWVDEQAGQLRFNFINANHSQLPFDASLTFVDKEEEILSDYLSGQQHTEIETVKVY